MRKFCSKCKQHKELSEFWKDKYQRDGYRLWCKLCSELSRNVKKHNEYQKMYRLTHRENVRKWLRTWRLRHKARATEMQNRYRQTDSYKAHHRLDRLKRLNRTKVFVTSREVEELIKSCSTVFIAESP